MKILKLIAVEANIWLNWAIQNIWNVGLHKQQWNVSTFDKTFTKKPSSNLWQTIKCTL